MAPVQFNVLICDDVLIEMLGFGTRRELAKIEIIGHRIQHILDFHLLEKPVIALKLVVAYSHNAQTFFRFSKSPVNPLFPCPFQKEARYNCEYRPDFLWPPVEFTNRIGKSYNATYVPVKPAIITAKMLPIKPYVHFRTVALNPTSSATAIKGITPSIESIAHHLLFVLKQLHATNAKQISFYAPIGIDSKEDSADSSSIFTPSNFVDYFGGQLLPLLNGIIDYSLTFTFHTLTTTDENMCGELFASLINLWPIKKSKSIYFTIYNAQTLSSDLTLPIESILDWFQQSTQYPERCLTLDYHELSIGNINELIERVKKTFLNSHYSMNSQFVLIIFWACKQLLLVPICDTVMNKKTNAELIVKQEGIFDEHAKLKIILKRKNQSKT